VTASERVASDPRIQASRHESPDVFRGLAVIGMMLVDWPGSWDVPHLALFEHAHGLGVSDPLPER